MSRASCPAPGVLLAAFFAIIFAPTAAAQWNPSQGQWDKADAGYVRVMTWNVKDGICSTNAKQEGYNNWTGLAMIVAALQPDILILQEAGDNDGNGTGGSCDSVSELATTIGLFFDGGSDPFHGNVQVTAYVQKYAPGYTLPHVFVSSETDGWNRNTLVSRFPFKDLNGDGRDRLSDIPRVNGDLYAPGGDGEVRGFQFAEIDLPDADYLGDLVIGNAHLKAGNTGSDKARRLEAAKNVAYVIDYWYNGASSGIPDPRNRINDSPAATKILDAYTPVIFGGDWNEDELSNGRDGPALWLVRAEVPQNDGTDRDRSDSTYDDASDPISGSRETYGWSSKLDYIARQDSIALAQNEFVFNSASLNSTQMPSELSSFPNPSQASDTASDHRPVIVDFELPAQGGGANPIPDIKVDGQDGPIYVVTTQTVDITLHLDPGGMTGTSMDWWVIAERWSGGTFSWVYSLPYHWTSGTVRSHAGPLFALPSYSIHKGTVPWGTWTFTFAVDQMDNAFQGTHSDTIAVTSY